MLSKLVLVVVLLLSLLSLSVVNGSSTKRDPWHTGDIVNNCITNFTYVGTNKSLSVCYSLQTDTYEDIIDIHNRTHSYHTIYTYKYYYNNTLSQLLDPYFNRLKNITTIQIGQKGYIDTKFNRTTTISTSTTRRRSSYMKQPLIAHCKFHKHCNTMNDTYWFDCSNLKNGRTAIKCESITPFFYPFTI